MTYSGRTLAARILLFGLLRGTARAQTSDRLPDYAPLPPQIKAKAPTIDPKKGYVVLQLKPDVYMITEGAYESAFVTTGKGVVLFAAPPSFAQHFVRAVADTTSEAIVELVYSHLHVDHIGGAGFIQKQIPNLEILAEEGTADFLREIHDPHRPVPTRTFKDHYTLKLGSLTAEGDLLISIPDKKVVIDRRLLFRCHAFYEFRPDDEYA
jgi:glyoxylase-like metal-dependent hydrolase (beta-lactamase superfamily II)